MAILQMAASVLLNFRRLVSHNVFSAQPAGGTPWERTLGAGRELPGGAEIALIEARLRRCKVGIRPVALTPERDGELTITGAPARRAYGG
jgi:hypothetical protein